MSMCDSGAQVSWLLAVCRGAEAGAMRIHIAGDMSRTLVTSPTLMVFVAPLPRSSNGNSLPRSIASIDRFVDVEIFKLSKEPAPM